MAAYRAKGTVQMVRLLNGANAFPTRYWRKGHVDDFEPLSAETMIEKYLVKNEVCPPCFMQCVKHCKVPEGEPLAGLELDGPEYETIYVFGGLCEINDFAQVMRMNDICDRLGIDTMRQRIHRPRIGQRHQHVGCLGHGQEQHRDHHPGPQAPAPPSARATGQGSAGSANGEFGLGWRSGRIPGT